MASCKLNRNHQLKIVAFIAACTSLLLSNLARPSLVLDSKKWRSSDGHVPEFAVGGIFPGAREWHDHWSYASRRGGGAAADRSHVHDERVASAAESLSEAARRHIDGMRERYEGVAALPDFYARGLGWIQDRLGMVLTVIIVGDPAPTSTNDPNVIHLHPGNASIYIVDTIGKLKCGGKDDAWIDRQPPLTMWVRANGPEIFAGTATPHRLESPAPGDGGPCAWRYDFEAERSGTYSIHAKVLTFNGFADFDPGKCETERLPSRNARFDTQKAKGDEEILVLEAANKEAVGELSRGGNYTHHRGLSGFKMYGAIDACCEACTRARNCKLWSIPGERHYDNCELYFDRIEDDLDFSDREDGRYLGRQRRYKYIQQNVSEFPDIRRRKLRRRRLAVSPEEMKKPWPIAEAPSKGRPRGEAVTYFIGCGWSTLMTFENPCHYPSDDLVFGSGKKVSIVSDVPDPGAEKALRSCTIADEEIYVADGRWVRYPYPDDSVCGLLRRDTTDANFRGYRPAYRGDLDPKCWHRDNPSAIANICGEPGCQWVIKHRWMTDLKRDTRWFGLWEQRRCAYRDMGDDLIQKCVRVKNIRKILSRGASLSGILSAYLNQKLKGIEMNGARDVFLNTLKMPHVLWHKPEEEFRTHLENDFPDVSAVADEHFWMTGFYFTSEREPHVQVDRSLRYSKMARDVLTPKGYKMINAFDVSAAFSFDTDAQADGLHIDGPPPRVVVTKLFHHLCRDVL